MDSFPVTTRRHHEMVDITRQVSRIIADSKVIEGMAVVYSPHTTAGIAINEHCDPDVVHDALLWMERQVPRIQPGFRHGEGNSDSHIKAIMTGASATLIVHKGAPVLGTWQGVFFCEFDGPRTRTVHVQVLGEKAE
jgi:secondary thiamine-phosphate synthase enzyme